MLFHIIEGKGPILLGLNTLRKIGIFMKYQVLNIETVDLYSSEQNLARCDP